VPAARAVAHTSEPANNDNPEVGVVGESLEGADDLKGGLMELILVVHGAGWCWVVWGYERPNGFGNGVGLSKASVSARSLVACEVQGESAKKLASMSPFIEGWVGCQANPT
jgi:hypothetical protein